MLTMMSNSVAGRVGPRPIHDTYVSEGYPDEQRRMWGRPDLDDHFRRSLSPRQRRAVAEQKHAPAMMNEDPVDAHFQRSLARAPPPAPYQGGYERQPSYGYGNSGPPPPPPAARARDLQRGGASAPPQHEYSRRQYEERPRNGPSWGESDHYGERPPHGYPHRRSIDEPPLHRAPPPQYPPLPHDYEAYRAARRRSPSPLPPPPSHGGYHNQGPPHRHHSPYQQQPSPPPPAHRIPRPVSPPPPPPTHPLSQREYPPTRGGNSPAMPRRKPSAVDEHFQRSLRAERLPPSLATAPPPPVQQQPVSGVEKMGGAGVGKGGEIDVDEHFARSLGASVTPIPRGGGGGGSGGGPMGSGSSGPPPAAVDEHFARSLGVVGGGRDGISRPPSPSMHSMPSRNPSTRVTAGMNGDYPPQPLTSSSSRGTSFTHTPTMVYTDPWSSGPPTRISPVARGPPSGQVSPTTPNSHGSGGSGFSYPYGGKWPATMDGTRNFAPPRGVPVQMVPREEYEPPQQQRPKGRGTPPTNENGAADVDEHFRRALSNSVAAPLPNMAISREQASRNWAGPTAEYGGRDEREGGYLQERWRRRENGGEEGRGAEVEDTDLEGEEAPHGGEVERKRGFPVREEGEEGGLKRAKLAEDMETAGESNE